MHFRHDLHSTTSLVRSYHVLDLRVRVLGFWVISRPDPPLRVRPLEMENNYFLYYNIYNKQFYTTLSLQNIEESYCYCVRHRRTYRFCGGYEAGC